MASTASEPAKSDTTEPRWRARFTLRTMLVLTALFAVNTNCTDKDIALDFLNTRTNPKSEQLFDLLDEFESLND